MYNYQNYILSGEDLKNMMKTTIPIFTARTNLANNLKHPKELSLESAK